MEIVCIKQLPDDMSGRSERVKGNLFDIQLWIKFHRIIQTWFLFLEIDQTHKHSATWKGEFNPFQTGLLYFDQSNDRYKHVNLLSTKTVWFDVGPLSFKFYYDLIWYEMQRFVKRFVWFCYHSKD